MARRLPLLILLGALSGVAHAWYWESGNPGGSPLRQPQLSFQVKGQVSSFKLTGRHGRQQVVRLPRPYDLQEALPLPAGDWVELTLVPRGPVRVEVAGGPPLALHVPELTVVLDDPAAREVHLEWSLPEGAWRALQAGMEVAGLPDLLQDGAVAVPQRGD